MNLVQSKLVLLTPLAWEEFWFVEETEAFSAWHYLHGRECSAFKPSCEFSLAVQDSRGDSRSRVRRGMRMDKSGLKE